MKNLNMSSEIVFVTGCAGFIGMSTAYTLLQEGYAVVGIDNINNAYDPLIKKERLKKLTQFQLFTFILNDIEDKEFLESAFQKYKPSYVFNFAARAGVRASLLNPYIYTTTNEIGVLNLLEMCRQYPVKKFIQASTSSVYEGETLPFKEDCCANAPISPYAASKKAAELYIHTYHHLYNINTIILRFFTVYGPFGRPDMSILRFIKWIDEGISLEVYGDGTQKRDFTYISDIVDGVLKAMNSVLNDEIINLGNHESLELLTLIKVIEERLGKKAQINFLPSFKADAKDTWANIDKAKKILQWTPKTDLIKGIEETVIWYQENKSWLKDLKLL